MKAKKCGFSNKYIADILSISKRDILELLGDIEPQKAAIKISDTAYSLTYNNAAPAEKLGGKTALIIGAGPTKIGCMGEARYAAVLASHSLKAHGYKTIYINPEKIADNLFDRTYCEPITIEDVIEVCKIEKPDVIITDFAGANAGYITKADIPADVLEHEKAIQMEAAKTDEKLAGKPEAVVAKIIEGKVNKQLSETTLYEQDYLLEPGTTVGKFLNSRGVNVVKFVRYMVGEGIEKRKDDFAAEVMSQIK